MNQNKEKIENPICDPRLSWQATGLLAFMLNHGESSLFTVNDLVGVKPKGTRLIRILQELISFGYVDRQETREQGRFSGVVYKLNTSIL